MKRLYYYVQKCPKCRSRLTGEFKKMPKNEDDAIFVKRQHLKNGELIEFVEEVPYENVYCENCGHTWHYVVEEKWISKKRKEEEKKARLTLVRLLEFNKEHPRKKKKSFARKIISKFKD